MRVRSFIAFLSILVALPALCLAGEGKSVRLAGFGNSLMGNIQLSSLAELASAQGHTLEVEATGAAGAPMPWLWDAKPKEIKAILDKGNWDALLLQPFLRPIEDDKKGAKNFIDYAVKKSPGIKVYIYAQFLNDYGLDYQDVWLQDVSQYVQTGQSADHNIRANRSKGYYEALTREVRKMYPGREVVMVPSGHAFALLDQKIKAGQLPGISSIYELYADGTHVNNFGSYLVGMTWYAALFHESPVGLPIGAYQGDPKESYTRIITPEQAKIMQEVAWAVTASHPLSGVSAPQEKVQIATPGVMPNPVTGEAYHLDLFGAFGKQPLRWSISKGELPAGLKLTEDGKITGTPSEAGTKQAIVQVNDAAGQVDSAVFDVTVEEDTAPRITTTQTDLGTIRAGEVVRLNVQAEGGNGRLRWSFAKARPGDNTQDGLRLLGTGTLVGAIGKPGRYAFDLRVTDSDPAQPESDEQRFTVTVGQAAPGVVLVPKIPRGSLKAPWTIDRAVREGKAKPEDFYKQFTFPSHPVVSGKVDPAFDNEARFQVFHDGGSLYTVLFVKDDEVVVDEKDPTSGDSVEIFFDIFNDREKVYNADDRHAIVTADGQVSGSPGRKSNLRAMRTEDGYMVFMRMPGHDMKRKLEDGAVLGFDVAVNDKDSAQGPTARVYFHGDKRNAVDTSNFGTIILTDEPPQK